MGGNQRTTRAPGSRARTRAPARALLAVLLGSVAIVAAQVGQRPVPAQAALPNTNTPTNTTTGTPTDTPTNTPTDTVTTAPDTPTNTPTSTVTTAPDTPTNTSTATVTPPATNTATRTATFTGTPTRTPSNTEAGQCSDRIDNDNNGFTDCQDPACIGTGPCAAGAPALSPMFLAFAFGLLTLVGLLRLRRRFR